MNIQPSKPDKPDSLERLFQLWGLTPKNESLARAYLTNGQADDSLLSGAERQIFPSFGWQEQRKISEPLAKSGQGTQAPVGRRAEQRRPCRPL